MTTGVNRARRGCSSGQLRQREVARPGDTDSVAAAMTRMRERVEAGDDFGTNPPAGQDPREWVIRHASAAAMGHGYDRILRQVVS